MEYCLAKKMIEKQIVMRTTMTVVAIMSLFHRSWPSICLFSQMMLVGSHALVKANFCVPRIVSSD